MIDKHRLADPIASRARVGFSLIELLVVIAIVAVLIGLLLPAVQKVRAAAARLQCDNNLKQVGVALQSYHDTNQAFPAGYVSGVDGNGDDTGPGWGWASFILPQLEQQALLQEINFSLPIESPANAAGRLQPVAIYLCPADVRLPAWTAYSHDALGNPIAPICDVAAANYIGMFGTSEPGVDGEGVFFRNSAVSLTDITDGASQTILVGERAHDLGEATWVGSVTGATLYNPAIGNSLEEGAGMVLGHAGEKIGPGALGSEVNQFSSKHGSGANFLFADGHVKFLPSTFDYRAFEALSTRAGGDTVSGDY